MEKSKYAFRYTDEHVEFLRDGYMQMGVIKLAKVFNEKFGLDKTPKQISSLLKSRNIKCGRGTGELMKGVSKLFTPEQVEFIRANYGPMSRKELLAAVNEKFELSIRLQQLVSFVKNHNIKSGRTGYFKKGVPSWSKGTKGVLKGNSGSFKKGQTPHNWVPVGSERVNTIGYRDTKVAEPNVWVGNHILLWEKHHGPVPKDHNVRFKDGDKTNIELSNLILVNKSEHQYLNHNQHASQPEELKETVLLLSRVQAKTSQLRKQESDHA